MNWISDNYILECQTESGDTWDTDGRSTLEAYKNQFYHLSIIY